jgi:hypothetical protein
MSGAVAALPMWKAIAEDGLAQGWLAKGEKFQAPPGVVMKDVEYYTGLLPGQGSDRTLQEAFVAGTEPNRQYNNRWQTITSLPWYQQRAFYIPKEGESMAPAAPPTPGSVPGEPGTQPGPEGQVVGEGDEGTVVPPPAPLNQRR